jgi:hypothetical protein
MCMLPYVEITWVELGGGITTVEPIGRTRILQYIPNSTPDAPQDAQNNTTSTPDAPQNACNNFGQHMQTNIVKHIQNM